MITDQHRAFARDMVALARRHRMNNLVLTFNASHWTFAEDGTPRGPGHYAQVRMSWADGRHGVANPIELRMETGETIPETEFPEVAG